MPKKMPCSTKLSSERSPSHFIAAAMLSAALAVGCGDGGEADTVPFGSGVAPVAGGSATGVGAPGTGPAAPPASATGTNSGGTSSTIGTSSANNGGTSGTSGGGMGGASSTGGTSGTGTGTRPVGGADAGVAGTTPAAGSADTPWCKIKAISDAKCAVCHTTPAVAGAPFPLKTYQDFMAPHPSKPGKKVYERVGFRIHADKSQTENLTSMPPGTMLPADQLALIDSWVAAGAPDGGNPTCAGAAAPVKAADVEWPPKECDGVYKLTSHGSGDSAFMVAPGSETHPQVTLDAPWGNEEVQAIAFKAVTDNPAVLHHWILYAPGFIVGWAPGEDGVKELGPDVGVLLPGGSGSLRLDMHYNSLTQTKAQPDKSGTEVCIVKKAKFRKHSAAVTMGLANALNLVLPPNSKDIKITSSCTVSSSEPITLLSASPHAHKMARRMVFTLKKKGGQLITMHDMPFMFGEQKTYPLSPPVVAENGDVITTTCIYDNDTSKTVTFGENTGNEMCFNFAMYYPAGKFSCGGGLLGGGGFLGGN